MDPTKPAVNAELVAQLMKSVSSPEQMFGPGGLFQQLRGAVMERLLEAEMTAHIGFKPNDPKGYGSGNARNGHTPKRVLTENGPVDIRVPRDRKGTFEPKLLPKYQRRLEGFDDKVLALYARGMSMREIQSHLSELYGTEVSPELISSVTDAVLGMAREWRERPLSEVYPVVYLDALFVSVRDNGVVKKKAIYVALGMTVEGDREVLGLWVQQSEGAKFWLSILSDLKTRGVRDIFYVCCDGLTGFPQAIEAAFPLAVTQTCIVHMIRSSTRQVSHRDRKKICDALRPIYTATSEESALTALTEFEREWGQKVPQVAKAWRSRWSEVVPFLSVPPEVRHVLYTTNAVESLNAQLRRVLRPKGAFPNDEAVFKVLFLALDRARLRLKAPRSWGAAMRYFAVAYAERMSLA
jgi:putative transposase